MRSELVLNGAKPELPNGNVLLDELLGARLPGIGFGIGAGGFARDSERLEAGKTQVIADCAGIRARDEIARSRRAREGMVRTEEDIPETPPTEAVSTLGDEVLLARMRLIAWSIRGLTMAQMLLPEPEDIERSVALFRSWLRAAEDAGVSLAPGAAVAPRREPGAPG